MPGMLSMDPSVFEPAESWGPAASLLLAIVIGCMTTAPLIFAAWRWIAHRGRAMRAESKAREIRAKPIAPDAQGPVLLQGKIVTDDGGPAVRIQIDQRGREWSNKGNWSHEWRETRRSVIVRPFDLALADGSSVTVVPDDRVRVVDALETEKVDHRERRRVAALSHGESVFVSGVLAREGAQGGARTPYREGRSALVVRGARFEPMEIASGKLDVQFAHWRDWYVRATLFTALAFLFVHAGLLGGFYARAALGRVETATFERAHVYTTSSKNGVRYHYVLNGRLSSGAPVSDEVSMSLYNRAKEGRVTSMPFTVVPAASFATAIGAYPSLGAVASIIALAIGAAEIALFVSLRSRAMPWYEQWRVIERGSGQLAGSAWLAQAPGKHGAFVEFRR